MLQEYINDYITARDSGDTSKMKTIEKDLARLGMDKYTLGIIVGKEKRNDP